MIARINPLDKVKPIGVLVKAEMTGIVLNLISQNTNFAVCPICGEYLVPDDLLNFFYCPDGHDFAVSGVYKCSRKIQEFIINYFCDRRPYLKTKEEAASVKMDKLLNGQKFFICLAK